MTPQHITVCICTYRRPELLRRLLRDLTHQQTDGQFTFSVVVCDNDGSLTARPVVEELSATSTIPIVYCVEPRRNIALARNSALEHAGGELIAFIDDDEFPVPDWLGRLYATCKHT